MDRRCVEEEELIKAGATYKHYKGKLYKVLAIAYQESTNCFYRRSYTANRRKMPMFRDGKRVIFKQRVLEVVKTISSGQTMTYGQVAALAGNPRAARAVGMILSRNFDSTIPCHRVIRANGDVGGYNRGSENKIRMLRSEKT